MPPALRIRLACVAAIAAVSQAWPHAPITLMWTTYAVGFGHYLLALRYSTGPLRQMLASASHLLVLLGLVLASATLYQTGLPFFLYFGLHHALNEAYMRRSISGLPVSSARLNGAAAVFQLAAYLTTLRWSAEIALIDPLAIWLAFAAAAGLLVWTAARMGAASSLRERLELCAPEVTSAALVAASLFVHLTFLQLVLFHFVLWALLPIERMRQCGGARGVIDYAGLSVACTGAALLLSPVGPAVTRLPTRTYSEVFLFWSYLHITLSFALSDAHPAWTIRLFRGALRRDVAVSAPAAG